jgi:hypothetical protein
MLEEGCAITVVADVENDSVALPSHHVDQRTLALFDRNAAQVLAIKFDQIEGASTCASNRN